MSSSPFPHAPSLAKTLESWFETHGRDYPWRRTTDPYAILVSEMMLQQTQITTVLDRGYYARWMERFPDVPTLAAASEHEVLRTWEGLGYYRRARFLHQLAKTVLEQHDGVFPRNTEAIRALPGVGRYTAGAVASFAFDASEPIVDGNVARVLARLGNDTTPVDSTAGQLKLWEQAQHLVKSARSPRKLNSALMELGQRICRTGTPLCGACPVKKYCTAEEPASLPVKSKRTTITEVTERVFFHRTDSGILLQQETGQRRTGLWKLPALPETANTSTKLPLVLHKAPYTITRYRVTLWVHEAPAAKALCALTSDPAHRFVSDDELPHLPMPSPYRKALNAVLATANFALEA
jgi:A/G-specific adenine glycosylase